jgi:hypothetical protein
MKKIKNNTSKVDTKVANQIVSATKDLLPQLSVGQDTVGPRQMQRQPKPSAPAPSE